MSLAPLVIINPAAGRGRIGRSVPWLRERVVMRPEARLEITARPGDAEALAAGAARRGHDRVLAIGGDGTVQEVVNGLLTAAVPASIGIVPVGSGNDLARSLGLPDDLAAAWRVAMGATTRPIDVARAHNGSGAGRWFASAGGVGFDAQVAAAMARRSGWQAGRAGYLLTTLSELRRFENRHVRLTLDGETSTREVLFVAIANGAYYGGGMRIAPGALPDDGHLDVCVVGDISRLTALRELPNLYRGTHLRNPAVSMATAREIEIDGDAQTRVHLDGEPFGTLPLRVSLTPRALHVAAPRRDDRRRHAATLGGVEADEMVPGMRLLGRRNARIGTVDAVFADYLLVRTAGLLPIDLYVPRPEVTVGPDGLRVDGSPAEAYERWHRPLKRAPHA